MLLCQSESSVEVLIRLANVCVSTVCSPTCPSPPRSLPQCRLQPCPLSSPLSPAAAAAFVRAPFKKRPRHFWEGPDPADADVSVKDKQESVHVSPVARLYRHALESVFEFLDLANLSRVLAVSRAWAAPVRSMKSICAAVSSDHVRSWLLAASPLAAHVRHFGSPVRRLVASCSDLFILSRPPISLLSLRCTVDLSQQPLRLFLGASLESVTLQLQDAANTASVINDAIVTVSRLPSLTKFDLRMPSFFPEVNFAPLAGAPQPQDLRFFPLDGQQATAPQLEQLRRLDLRSMWVICAAPCSSSGFGLHSHCSGREFALSWVSMTMWQRLCHLCPF